MELLVEIPREKWSELRELYRLSWPEGVVASCLLDTQISYPGLNQTFNFKVYCPEGNLTNGMVAVSDRAGYKELLIHPIDKNTTKIEHALLITRLVDWKTAITVPSANSDVIACLERIHKSVGVKIDYGDKSKAFKHILSKNSEPFKSLICPPDTYVGPLKTEHLDIIDKTWTFHSDISYGFFKALKDNNLGYVLYSTNDEPLAWMAVSEAGSLTHLYCSEQHRRKGYSEFITKYGVNDLLQKGKDVLAYTLDDNVKAQSLFNKLGFDLIGYDFWVFLNKKE